MAWSLAGKVALVTGGGTRLGKALAEGLGAAGADVAVHFNGSRDGAAAACAAISVTGNRARGFQADLTVPEAAERLVAAVEAALGPVDILVNSAALFEPAPLATTSLAILERQWALNARAPLLLAQAVIPSMRRKGAGDIVNLLDVGGTSHVWREYGAYTMTKAAANALTKGLALELAPSIRVNAIAPGTVLAPEGYDEAANARLLASIPQQRFGTPKDVVETLLFLLTGSRFITGQVLAVDGGRSIAAL
jgi:pteridine reductase